jgi:hypothetical protein
MTERPEYVLKTLGGSGERLGCPRGIEVGSENEHRPSFVTREREKTGRRG